MIAVDTNILVYAHRGDAAWHDVAEALVRGLAEGRAPWSIPWPCLHEFLGVVTHPRIYRTPTPAAKATDQVDAWLESPTLQVLGETDAHWAELKASILSGRVSGPQVHDARIAALCATHGVDELWTADRDFSRFPRLNAVNPLVR